MNRYPARYVFLRARRSWTDCVLDGLQSDADGNLARRRIPGLVGKDVVDLAGPYLAPASGIASSRGVLVIAQTEADRVLIVDSACATRTLIPSPSDRPGGLTALSQPAGVAISGDWIWVADSGHDRAICFAIPTLETAATLEGLAHPVAIVADRAGRLYVLEAATQCVRRFTPWLEPDDAFNAAFAASLATNGHAPGAFTPQSIAVADSGDLLIADGAANAILRVDADGGWLDPIVVAGVSPGSIAVRGDSLVVADRADGALVLVELSKPGTAIVLPGFRGPVSALCFDDDGNLLVKTGGDEAYVTMPPASASIAVGTVTHGPVDAGLDLAWWKASISGDRSRGGSVTLHAWQTDDPALVPGPADWRALPADSALLPNAGAAGHGGRYLWLRATLAGAADEEGPTLAQVSAQTRGEDYLDYLPAVYRNTDAPTHFLERLLAHTQDQLAALESNIDSIDQRLSAGFAPEEDLDWLAGFMAFDLPLTLTAAQKRTLFARIVALQDRRGTPASLAAAIELQSGVRPTIHEAFRDRRIWILDDEEGAQLGFDTGLPASEPDGIVVADAPLAVEANVPDCAPSIGSFTAGESVPLPVDEWGRDLFDDTAHLFQVILPADAECRIDLVESIRALVEREKPAHTAFGLCFAPDAFRVGDAARVGIDTIVGGPGSPAALDSDAALDEGFILGGSAAGEARYQPFSSPNGRNNHGAGP